MKELKLAWKILKYKPGLYLANILAWSIVEVIPVIPPLIIKKILDSFTGDLSLKEGFWWLIALTVAVYLVRILFIYCGFIAGVTYGFTIVGLLRHNLLKMILRRPGSEPKAVSTGEALNAFRDDTSAISEMTDWPVDVFAKFLGAVVAIIILIRVNLPMTLIIIFPLFILLSLLQQLRKRIHIYREASRRATSRVVGTMGEIFAAAQGIQVANAEKHVINQLKHLNKIRERAMLKDTLFIKIVEAILNNIVHLGTGMILLLSARSMISGSLSIGEFTLFISYWFIVADFSGNFGGLLSAYHQGKVSINRLIDLGKGSPAEDLVAKERIKLWGGPIELLYKKPEVEEFKELAVENLSYTYPNSKNGIKDISFIINKGSFTVITGRVGSGKSTLVKALLGLLASHNGDILWNGRKVENPADFMIPPRIAYTGQTPSLFSDSIRSNILLGPVERDNKILEEVIYSAVLEKDIEAFNDGLDTMIGPRGVRLSGGQLQRVAAARMFFNKPQLYVFDDISSALDLETEKLLWTRLFNKSGATTLAISNRKSVLERADEIIVMLEGEIAAKGSLSQLIATSEELKRIYGREEDIA